MNKSLIATAIGAALSLSSGACLAAAPADWSQISAMDVTLFYPGVSPVEWVTKGVEHGGARALKKGERCADCHSEEAADIGQLIVSGEKNEPNPPAGKAPAINAKVQAAHDGENLYLRFTWQQPAASGGAKMDETNPVKIAYMLEDGNKVELAEQGGCWGSCHMGVRTMPEGDSEKTKYVKGGSLADGVFFDLNQWRSGENKAYDGYVAEQRVMEGGTALVGAEGKNDNGNWSVVFTRKFTGGEGDVSLAAGKVYNFGFAIHDDSADGRYHHVSLGLTLGIDAEADINAKAQ